MQEEWLNGCRRPSTGQLATGHKCGDAAIGQEWGDAYQSLVFFPPEFPCD